MPLLPFASAPSTGASTSPLTTKGDLYGFSTVGTRVPVGVNGQVLQSDSTNATGLSWIAVGGTGTVTSVSVVTANGVSATVATPTTTPAITVALGAITPTSVASTGAVTGTNLSGTNTGDQTNITGTAGTITGTITELQVTNLVTDLASKSTKGFVIAMAVALG